MAGNFSTNIATGASTAIEALGQRQTQGLSKSAGAAKDFEALLIGQMLRSMHEEGGWLGTGEDQAGDAAIGLGEEQLARSLAASGGLGLSRMIESGLDSESQNQAKTTAPDISAPR